MEDAAQRALAIVGVSAILPDAPDVGSFWENLKQGRYSIGDVPEERWDPALYYDPDPGVPDKTYSKLGAWVRDWEWDPIKWRLPIPPKVADAMDDSQKWAVACARSALLDYGHPERALDFDRTAVVIGTAMAGNKHYMTSLRVFFPEFARALSEAPAFGALPPGVQETIRRESYERMAERLPEINEDTMPGELANCIAGRIANLFDFHGPNFVCDAACASALAAIDAAHDGILEGEFDAALVGGVDANMGPAPYVKFSKIGALSATGTRPYADGADGFVMGEGSIFFLVKRLADAEAQGDRIYAVLRGIGGSSDGRGKGITAPNPAGQRLAIERAWRDAGLSPATATLVEGHGTSTRVGDVVEVGALNDVFGSHGLTPGSIALGSVKSNIGHLKGAAGAAGLLKVVLALHEKTLPPSLHCEKPNPNIDFSSSPLVVNTELKPWDAPPDGVRRAGVSAFGFGGTNYHAVLEEYRPGLLERSRSAAVPDDIARGATAGVVELKAPPRGALVLGEADAKALRARLEEAVANAKAGSAPPPAAPAETALRAAERIAIDFADAAELATKGERALKAFAAAPEAQPALWKALRSQGVFRGSGAPAKVAFLYTGQGSQYANMLRELRASEAVVAETFDAADRVMQPLLGHPISDLIFPDPEDADAVKAAEAELRRTEITQPAVLTVDAALTRLLAVYGLVPDLVMGHSLGEYGALVASGALPFEDALEAVSARGRGMAQLSIEDNGLMAAVFAPLEEIEEVIASVDGNVVVANINSRSQAVIGGATPAVEAATLALGERGHNVVQLTVSHAFHTSIVAPASEPLRQALENLRLAPPELPLVGNVNGELYPTGPNAVPQILDLLARQVASPVQFVKGLETLYAEGARVFVEVGPKKALHGFASDVLGDRADVVTLFTNHPKLGDATSLNHALCGLWSAGLGLGAAAERAIAQPVAAPPAERLAPAVPVATASPAASAAPLAGADRRFEQLGRLFAEFIDRGSQLLHGDTPRAGEPPVVTGAALGLPGRERVFDDLNVQHILDGEQEIDLIPTRFRHAMVEKQITRLVKTGGDPHFEHISNSGEVIKLAARAGTLDLEQEFGIPADRIPALDATTKLAMAAGIEALRDAGIPLVMHYRTTTKGTQLPERWMLPDELRDDTGVIFASAFPGFDSFADELERWAEDRAHEVELETLRALLGRVDQGVEGGEVLRSELERRIHEVEQARSEHGYQFDRRFLFRILPMAHAQFAEYVGARGPNTHVNSACASTTQAFSLAEDWIAAGRCRRVVILAADDVTTDHLLEWIGSGFLATGAAATDDVVEDAALPFDRRRHGMILGMGAAGAVVEAPACARERGLRPICDLLSTVTANSAFHGTRLDVEHIGGVMERVVAQAERRFGLDRQALARELVFVSHETYTPARGGSASAEVEALRRVFGDAAQQIVVANTKGLTGHPMGVGIEDVVAIKALETGVVPPVPNYREVDPELGPLKLSRGGSYPIRYALRLGAGFGSQISMSLLRWTPTPDGHRPAADALGYRSRLDDAAAYADWLRRVSGDPQAEVEVTSRTLRVQDRGPASVGRPAAPTPAPIEAPAPAAAPIVAATPAPASPPQAGAQRAAGERSQTDATAGERSQEDATAEVAAAPASGGQEDEVRERVLAIIAEKTGYPSDMLDLDLDLEADLGIDTVKQAETFAAIREAYDIPRDENLQLRDYPTLAHAIQFVMERRPDRARESEAPVSQAPEAPEASPAGEPEAGERIRVSRVRAPRAVLRPGLEHCRPTGVELGEGSRVALMPDRGGVAKALATRLERRGVEVIQLDPACDADALAERLREAAPVDGIYWLPGLDADPPLDASDPAETRAALKLRVKLLYAAARGIYADFEKAGRFLVCGTRLGGRHGYDDAGAANPLGGAITGFAKAFARERPAALVKAVDFPETRKTAELAEALIDETLRDPGAVEIGVRDGLRSGVALVEAPAGDGVGIELGEGTVFLVTGAAGSIVSAIVADLAGAGEGTFHLLDLVPPPDPEDPDVSAFERDRDGLRRTLFERLRERGERATPVQIERELARVERAHAATQAIRAVESSGGHAHWHSVNLTDPAAVAKVVDEIREENGCIDVLVHAAGLEVSHQLPDKPPEEFDRVFDVKVDGWLNLLHAIGDMPLGAVVFFSSIAGRFGNAGQTDYAAANDLLCKMTTHLRRIRPSTFARSIDWTAWAEIGMASRGSIPEIMERAGIDMLPPHEGIPVVRNELEGGTASGEILVAGRLALLEAERDATGGVDPDAFDLAGAGPLLGKVLGLEAGTLRVATTLDPKQQPFLDHHRIDGTAVLPGVMGLEAFAEAAHALFPEHALLAIEDVRFLAPFKFYRDAPREIELCVNASESDGQLQLDCALVGRRSLAGQPEPQETLHFEARLQLGDRHGLGDRPESADRAPAPGAAPQGALRAEDLYAVYFHGPAYRVVETAWRDGETTVGRFAAGLPQQVEGPLATAPRLLELCFQTAGAWEIAETGKMGLPTRIERVSFHGAGEAGELHARVTRGPERDGFDAVVTDGEGNVRVRLEGYATAALPQPLPRELREPLRCALEENAS